MCKDDTQTHHPLSSSFIPSSTFRLFFVTHCSVLAARVCDLVPAGTCSVNERRLTDSKVEGCNPDNSASRVDGTIALPSDWTDKVKTFMKRMLMMGLHSSVFELVNPSPVEGFEDVKEEERRH